MPDLEVEWDETVAQDLVGAIVIIAITYFDEEDHPLEEVQSFGIVTKASREEGISIECHGETWKGETMTLPPVTTAFERAPPGEYTLRSTGETVVDPDFTAKWRMWPAPQ